MKSMIKRILIRILTSVVNRLGMEQVKEKSIDKNYLLNQFFTMVKNCGVPKNHDIDIAANHGTWTREAMEFFAIAKYTLVEPQVNLKAQ